MNLPVSPKELVERPKVATWITIFETYKQVYSFLETQSHKHGNTLPRFQIMFHLYFKGELSPAHLAKLLYVSRANMSTFIKRLLADKVITVDKEAGTAKRPKYKLSQEGIRCFEDYFPKHIANVEKVISPLDPATLESLKEMKKLAKEANDKF